MDNILLLAFSLSVLTYYLGTLIYALPIPWWGLKRWAPTLIYDGAASALLIFSAGVIVSSTEYIAGLLGASWGNFYSWSAQRISYVAMFTAGIGLLKTWFSSNIVGGNVFGAFVNPLITALTYVMIALETITIIGLIVQTYFTKMIFLGILLFSIPFRIARSIGAGLLSFAIVFYVGLPLLPLFTSYFSLTTIDGSSFLVGKSLDELGVAYCKLSFIDANGNRIPWVHAVFKDKSGIVYARYSSISDGTIDAGRPDKGLPLNINMTVVVYLSGKSYSVIPKEFNVKRNGLFDPVTDPSYDYYCTLYVPEVSWSFAPCLYASIRGEGEVVDGKYLEDQGLIELTVVARREISLEMVFPSSMTMEESFLDDIKVSPVIHEDHYNGNTVSHTAVINVYPGTHLFKAFFTGSPKPPNKGVFGEKYYVRDFIEGSGGIEGILRDAAKLIASLLVEWVILPTTYLTVLLSISYSLSRVIGGRGFRIPVKTP